MLRASDGRRGVETYGRAKAKLEETVEKQAQAIT